jgi:hypothetical protein
VQQLLPWTPLALAEQPGWVELGAQGVDGLVPQLLTDCKKSGSVRSCYTS